MVKKKSSQSSINERLRKVIIKRNSFGPPKDMNKCLAYLHNMQRIGCGGYAANRLREKLGYKPIFQE